MSIGLGRPQSGKHMKDHSSSRRKSGASLLALAAFAYTTIVRAEELHFGVHDIPTTFFISKSDDHNRVDYGMRLGSHCDVANNDAVFPYWREFERSPPVRTHALGAFEYFAYGLSEQRALHHSDNGGQYLVRLKQFGKRPIWIDTKREADGHCSALARCMIAGVKFAQLLSIYVKLSGPMSVSYVVVKGKNLETGQLLEERLTK